MINYKTEDLATVLKTEYSGGVNVVFESVGGKTFEACLNNLAARGTLIVIGSISNYKSDDESTKFDWSDKVSTSQLIAKSLTVTSFFLGHYKNEIRETLPELITAVATGKIKSEIDVASEGIENVYKAVEHLHSGKSKGKVVASIWTSTTESNL